MNSNKRLKDTKNLVMEIHRQNMDWNARQIYERYLILIGDASKAVTLNAVQKHLEAFKDTERQNQFLDRYWNLGLLIERPIHPDAIPYIFEIQAMLAKELPEVNPEGDIVVFQAEWIGRLYPVVKEARLLFIVSWVYCQFQAYHILLNRPLNTSSLDKALREGNLSFFFEFVRGSKLEKLIEQRESAK